MGKRGYTYIITNKKNGTLYIGVSSDLEKRTLQHKNKTFGGFSAKYNLDKLVWFQEFPTITEAIEWEKRLKGGNRNEKIKLIEKDNPNREDLAP